LHFHVREIKGPFVGDSTVLAASADAGGLSAARRRELGIE
jgi:hypothetical protein